MFVPKSALLTLLDTKEGEYRVLVRGEVGLEVFLPSAFSRCINKKNLLNFIQSFIVSAQH